MDIIYIYVEFCTLRVVQIAIALVSHMDTNSNVQPKFSLEYNSVDQKVIFVGISFPVAVPTGAPFNNISSL